MRNFGIRSTFQSLGLPMLSGGLPSRPKCLYSCVCVCVCVCVCPGVHKMESMHYNIHSVLCHKYDHSFIRKMKQHYMCLTQLSHHHCLFTHGKVHIQQRHSHSHSTHVSLLYSAIAIHISLQCLAVYKYVLNVHQQTGGYSTQHPQRKGLRSHLQL